MQADTAILIPPPPPPHTHTHTHKGDQDGELKLKEFSSLFLMFLLCGYRFWSLTWVVLIVPEPGLMGFTCRIYHLRLRVYTYDHSMTSVSFLINDNVKINKMNENWKNYFCHYCVNQWMVYICDGELDKKLTLHGLVWISANRLA